MKTIKISVTKEHITKGRPCSAGECPIALALIDAEFESPNVLGHVFYYGPAGIDSRKHCSLPNEAMDFIRKYDGLEVDIKPFEFEIEID